MDTLTLIVSYVGVFAIGAYIGYKVNEWLMRTAFDQMIDEAGLSDRDLEKFVRHWGTELGDPDVVGESERPQVQIRIEKHDDSLFCYEKATNKFLGQARSREELIDVLTERLGPVTLQIQPEDGAEYVQEGAK